jgi:hypothetical protein
MKKSLVLLCLVCFVFVYSLFGCGGGGGNESGGEGGDENGVESVDYQSKFDETAYQPIIEGATYSYSNGGEVIIENVDWTALTFEVKNTSSSKDPDGTLEGGIDYDEDGYYLNYYGFNNPDWMPVSDYFGYQRLIYENDSLYAGATWTDAESSNGYDVNITVRVNSIGESCRDGGGNQYDDCVALEVVFDYPDGYDWSVYITKQIFLLAKGIGFVDRTMYWTDSSQSNFYLMDYYIPD